MSVHLPLIAGLGSSTSVSLPLIVGVTPISGGTSGRVLVDSSGVLGESSSVADVTAAGTNTFTGTNTFSGIAKFTPAASDVLGLGTLRLSQGAYILALGDVDTTKGFITADAGAGNNELALVGSWGNFSLATGIVTSDSGSGGTLNFNTRTISTNWSIDAASNATQNSNLVFAARGHATYDNNDTVKGRIQFLRALTGYAASPQNYKWRGLSLSVNEDNAVAGSIPDNARQPLRFQLESKYVPFQPPITAIAVSGANPAWTRITFTGTVNSFDSSGLSTGMAICIAGIGAGAVNSTAATALNLETLTVAAYADTAQSYVDVTVSPAGLDLTASLTNATMFQLFDELWWASASFRPFFAAWNGTGGDSAGVGRHGLIQMKLPVVVDLPSGFIVGNGGGQPLARYSAYNALDAVKWELHNYHASGKGAVLTMSSRGKYWSLFTDIEQNGTDSFCIRGGGGTANSQTTRLYIDASGNIGIGNSAPGSKLDVTGTVTATGFVGGTGSFSTLTASNVVTLSPANQLVTISPTGIGYVTINPATTGAMNNMRVGNLTQSTGDFTSIGATVAGTGVFSTLTANGAFTASPANLNVVLSPTGTGVVTINPATAGSMNNVVIGGTTPLAVSATTLSATPASNGGGTLRINIVGGNAAVQIGNLVGTTSYGGIYLGNLTPSASNYTLTGDGTSTFLNAATTVYIMIGGVQKMSVAAGLVSIGQPVTLSSTLAVTGATTLTGALTQSAKTTTYNAIVTEGSGVVPIYKSPAQSATKTANFTALSYTPPATAGTYRVQGVITTTSATNTGTVQLTVDYVDSQGTIHTADILPLQDNAGTWAATKMGASLEFYSAAKMLTINNAATAIVLKAVITGSVSYTVTGSVEQIN